MEIVNGVAVEGIVFADGPGDGAMYCPHFDRYLSECAICFTTEDGERLNFFCKLCRAERTFSSTFDQARELGGQNF